MSFSNFYKFLRNARRSQIIIGHLPYSVVYCWRSVALAGENETALVFKGIYSWYPWDLFNNLKCFVFHRRGEFFLVNFELVLNY